jgi:hypothetical protein
MIFPVKSFEIYIYDIFLLSQVCWPEGIFSGWYFQPQIAAEEGTFRSTSTPPLQFSECEPCPLGRGTLPGERGSVEAGRLSWLVFFWFHGGLKYVLSKKQTENCLRIGIYNLILYYRTVNGNYKCLGMLIVFNIGFPIHILATHFWLKSCGAWFVS